MSNSRKGVYTLLIRVKKPLSIVVGKLGRVFFERGIYAYTGSALGPGGLRSRIKRHLSKRKKLFWHIDYLLCQDGVRVIAVFSSESDKRLECAVNQELMKHGFEVYYPGFGSSDCLQGCKSHLLAYKGRGRALRKVYEAYSRIGLKAAVEILEV